MAVSFRPDIFSSPKPKWTIGSFDSVLGLDSLLHHLPGGFTPSNTCVEYSGGLEINSSNLKISKDGQTILIKRWSKAAEESQLLRILRTMTFLANTGMPVPKPINFINKNVLLFCEGYYWSCYPFVDGDYFSGKGVEITNAALVTGKLTEILSKLPDELIPERGPLHLTDDDNEVLKEIDNQRANWKEFFGTEYTDLLEVSWALLMENWYRIRKSKIDPGPIAPVHFDLHPHNMIFNNLKASALLDFESCKMMPIGYALAFAGLKQCRQAVAFKADPLKASEVGKNYISVLSSTLNLDKSWLTNFCDLAIAEIIRRICIIFRLNMQGNKEWNRVLPVQLAHLNEAKALFEY
jgi:hypothetical protein